MQRWNFLALPLALLVASACDVTGPRYDAVSLHPQVVLARYDAERSFGEMIVELRIDNEGPEPVLYLSCQSNVERLVDGAWESIWDLACMLSSSTNEPVAIPAGASLVDRIHVGRGAGGDTGWQLPLDGRYRVVAGVMGGEFEVSEAARRSEPFPVRFDQAGASE